MILNFRRITSKEKYIPELDGLRFIAILSVVLYHLSIFLRDKDLNVYKGDYNFSFLINILSNGHIGVPLFFVISGFILSLPFLKMHLLNEDKINLKNYYLRRLTRIEPPYIIVMTALFFGSVYVAKSLILSEAIKSYFSSFFYVHNILYGKDVLPLINEAAWSLEIEIQFYILMPLIARLLFFKNKTLRRLVFLILILFSLSVNKLYEFDFRSIIDYYQYFLLGIFLADFYLFKPKKESLSVVYIILSSLFFSLIWIFKSSYFDNIYTKSIWEIIQLVIIFFFYYGILMKNPSRILSNAIITSIGGMCCSIYLIHYAVISLFGNPLMKFSFSNNLIINKGVYSILLLVLVLVICGSFFILVERPCMKKDWYKDIYRYFK